MRLALLDTQCPKDEVFGQNQRQRPLGRPKSMLRYKRPKCKKTTARSPIEVEGFSEPVFSPRKSSSK